MRNVGGDVDKPSSSICQGISSAGGKICNKELAICCYALIYLYIHKEKGKESNKIESIFNKEEKKAGGEDEKKERKSTIVTEIMKDTC